MSIDFSRMVTAEAAAANALGDARTAGIHDLLELSQAAALAITGPVPMFEMLSRSSREAAARAIIATKE